MARPYDKLVASMKHLTEDRTALMQQVVDSLWDALQSTGVSWVGFYLFEGGEELILGPSRDKPACSPIGVHGACGQAFKNRQPLVVRDVRELGADYIACDPRDQSEVVVPLFDDSGACFGVLDLDSYDAGSFDQSDVEGLRRVLQASGLSTL